MADVFCNNCGHRNPLGANFCSSCGAVPETQPPENTTITFHPTSPTDPTDEDVAVELEEVPEDIGVLVVKRGPQAGSRFALDNPVTTAGRHPDSDIFLDDITVSRRHAEIERRGTGHDRVLFASDQPWGDHAGEYARMSAATGGGDLADLVFRDTFATLYR